MAHLIVHIRALERLRASGCRWQRHISTGVSLLPELQQPQKVFQPSF